MNGVKVKPDGTVENESDAKLDPKVQKAIEDFEVTFEHKGSDVRINGKFKQGRKYWWKELNRWRILFHVTVPQQYNVNLEIDDGSDTVAETVGVKPGYKLQMAVSILAILKETYGDVHRMVVSNLHHVAAQST